MEIPKIFLKIKLIDAFKVLLFFGIAFRGVENFATAPSFLNVVLLLGLFLLLFIFTPLLHRRIGWSIHLIFLLQSGIIILLSFQSKPTGQYRVDYFVVFFMLLIIYAGEMLKQRLSIFWNVVFLLTMTGIMLFSYGVTTYALQFVFIYASIFLFMASYTFLLRKAEISDRESRDLLTELKVAYSKLQIFASQAKELAVVEERNRLARELHDSVTQTIFSMTLTADSAKILLEKDPGKVTNLLDRMQTLAKGALSEMRTLIAQLRPKTAIDGGLIEALRQHMQERKELGGLDVTFEPEAVEGIELPEKVAENLFRIVQEALNNVRKHAQANSATVILKIKSESVLIQVEDSGIGFDPSQVPPNESHLGLIGMRERIKAIDATFKIDSKPGSGTKITVEKQL
jgi:signal transduction histidine kinase